MSLSIPTKLQALYEELPANLSSVSETVTVCFGMHFPDEVLAEIFGRLCDFDRNIDGVGCPVISPHMPQYTLMEVCKAWRDVVLSRSGLWSAICLGDLTASPTAQALAQQERLLDVWISRSKSHLLEFNLFFNHIPSNKEDRVAAEALIKKVVSLANRWRSLGTQCYVSLMRQIAMGISTNPPKLTHTFMSVPVTAGLHGPLCVMDFPASSNLETFALQGYLRLRNWTTGVQRTALQTFIYQPYWEAEDPGLSLDDIYDLFVSCPALENVVVSVYNVLPFQSIVEGSQRKHLILRNIGRLRISTFDPAGDTEIDVGPLLDVLTFPDVEDFELMGPFLRGFFREDDDWNHLNEFLKRSTPPIIYFCIIGIPITSERLVECLAMLPDVTDLELTGFAFNNYVVSRLCWRPGPDEDVGGNILPRLSRLKIGGFSARFSPLAEFVHLVHSRSIVPDFVDQDSFLEGVELWQYLPDDILSLISLYKCGMWDDPAHTDIGHEFAQNSLIRHYVETGELKVEIARVR